MVVFSLSMAVLACARPPGERFHPAAGSPQDSRVAANGSPVAAPPAERKLAEAWGALPQSVVADSDNRLVGLSLEQIAHGQNMVVADLSSGTPYKLKKTAPSEYVLTLENTALDPVAARTLLAPPESGAIRSVRPITGGKDLVLRIFAAPQADLVVEAKSHKLLVREANRNDASTYDDMRAQPNPELTGTPAGGAPAAEPPIKPATPAAPAETSKPKEPDLVADAKKVEAGQSDQDRTVLQPDEADLTALLEDKSRYIGRLISLDLQDTDIDNALRIIAEVSNLNIIASDDVQGKVTLRLIDVPWDQALDVILKTNGLDKVQEGNVIRIAPVEKLRTEREALKQARQAEEELEPLQVAYIRISYARAADIKALVDTVVSERGTTAVDERTNQLIVKDIKKGVDNVTELVQRIDLRTPQVLLETQIVEANRNLVRTLGAELGFQQIQSPATGNATGSNFPNSIIVGGSLTPTGTTASSFPAAVSAAAGSAVSLLFGSADGTANLSARISSLETEGRARVVSRPAVATTNNRQATIKSTEVIRVKTPQGGLSVATGQGATAQGTSSTATEEIEVGIELTVTPQASPDYYVLLDINAKSSTFGTRLVDGIPSEVKREAQSTVLVSSGQTFALGGIYKIQDRDNVQGVPFLKDVPFLGYLFRSQLTDNQDEELLFFITPRIIEGSFDDAAMKAAS
jgi:type IV pilus secretin PilQ/predicted competence protein